MNTSNVEIYVTFLSFNSTIYTELPKIKFDEICVLDYHDLEIHRKFNRQQKNSIDPNVYKHYKWYNSILHNELNFAPEGCKLRLNQCEIESGNFNAFCLNGDFYTTITIIFGPEMEHWYYSVPGNDFLRMCGSKVLEKNHGIFDRPDILERRQKLLRPEPNDELLSLIKMAHSNDSAFNALPSMLPYYRCEAKNHFIKTENDLHQIESNLIELESSPQSHAGIGNRRGLLLTIKEEKLNFDHDSEN